MLVAVHCNARQHRNQAPTSATFTSLQSVLPASSGPGGQKGYLARRAAAPSSVDVAQLDCVELLAVNGQFGRTLEVMDALKATLRDEASSAGQQFHECAMHSEANPLQLPVVFASGMAHDSVCFACSIAASSKPQCSSGGRYTPAGRSAADLHAANHMTATSFTRVFGVRMTRHCNSSVVQGAFLNIQVIDAGSS